jgi:6-phosphogluconate dehydrogenase (decarboxylating)
MVHNGIEYGVMVALAEGLDIIASDGLRIHPTVQEKK